MIVDWPSLPPVDWVASSDCCALVCGESGAVELVLIVVIEVILHSSGGMVVEIELELIEDSLAVVSRLLVVVLVVVVDG